MKTEKYFVSLVLVAWILCVPVFGDVEKLPEPREIKLISQVNPALAGMEKLSVVIEPSGAEPNRDGLIWKELRAKVEGKLQQAGIGITAGNYSEPGPKAHRTPELRVYVDMLKFDESQNYVFRIQTSLAAEAFLERQGLFFKADVWKASPVMQAVSVQDMPGRVTNVVLEQIEAFTQAYLVANQPSGRPDAAVAPAGSVAGSFVFVGSKNTKIFHKSDCSAVQRISPQNLIGFNSRDDAVSADRRPCKRCNP